MTEEAASALTQLAHTLEQVRQDADPKKKEGAQPAKKVDLMKPMKTEAADQGFEGKQVQHKDGKTASADWHNEYGHEEPAPPLKKSGSMRCGIFPASLLFASAAFLLRQ